MTAPASIARFRRAQEAKAELLPSFVTPPPAPVLPPVLCDGPISKKKDEPVALLEFDQRIFGGVQLVLFRALHRAEAEGVSALRVCCVGGAIASVGGERVGRAAEVRSEPLPLVLRADRSSVGAKEGDKSTSAAEGGAWKTCTHPLRFPSHNLLLSLAMSPPTYSVQVSEPEVHKVWLSFMSDALHLVWVSKTGADLESKMESVNLGRVISVGEEKVKVSVDRSVCGRLLRGSPSNDTSRSKIKSVSIRDIRYSIVTMKTPTQKFGLAAIREEDYEPLKRCMTSCVETSSKMQVRVCVRRHVCEEACV